MDPKNLFATTATYRLLRLEYLVALAVVSYLALIHVGEINIPHFIALFLVIDLVGVLPAAIATRRLGSYLPKPYYVAYNVAHSLVTGALMAAAYTAFQGPSWTVLAIPIHLFGDRSLFGNFLKPFGIAFWGTPHPLYEEFALRYRREQRDEERVPGALEVVR